MTSIYVICAETGPSKIGIAGNCANRLKGFRTASPVELKLFFSAPVPSRTIAIWIESALHQFFGEHRLRGEWFNVHPERCAIAICCFIEEAYTVAGITVEGRQKLLDQTGITDALSLLLGGVK